MLDKRSKPGFAADAATPWQSAFANNGERRLGATGREHLTKTPVKTAIPKTGGALSGALSVNSGSKASPDLPAELTKLLSGLSAEDKAKLLAMLTDGDRKL